MLSIEKRKVEKNIKIKDLFDLCLIDKTKENESKNNFDIKIKTPLGFLNIEYFFCTEPLNKKRIILENGTHLLAADKHLVMTAHGWSHIRDLKIGDLIVTKDGNFKLKEISGLGEKEVLFDLQVEQIHCYYTNGILSHNSHCLVNVGAAAALNGLNVVEYTFELSELQVANRYDSYFSSVPISELKANKEKVKAAVNAISGRIIIKSYPTKTASVTTIRNHLAKLAITKDFKPDIIILDYADIMKSTKNYESKRFEHESVYEDIRALAMEYNIAMVTASQTNRASFDNEIVTLAGISESYAKAMVSDVVITMSRRLQDKTANTGRFFVAKNRFGPDGMVFPILINTETSKIEVMKSHSTEESLKELTESFPEEEIRERLAKKYQSFQMINQRETA